WLFQIAANVWKERWRRESARSEVEAAAGTSVRHATDSPDFHVGQREHLEQVWTFVQTLPEVQRRVLMLNVLENLSHQQIADCLGTSVGSVKTSLSIARAKLRERFP
ncbi:MAG TPA: sigma-70 family RNA polymerase sigma factor, partial [Pirellulaceae bacterium]|nr:sigma-70 family RNA polymerase sigma factor [Pirellulaceae bacterium]